MDPKTFKECRKKLGLTQRELAEKLGISSQQINNYERDRTHISRSTELALKQLLANNKAPGSKLSSLSLLELQAVQLFSSSLKKSLDRNIVLMVLFGSKVRGDSSEGSDLDMLIILKKFSPEIRHKIYEILFQIDPYYDFKISPTILSLSDFQENDEMDSPFISQIKKEGVWL